MNKWILALSLLASSISFADADLMKTAPTCVFQQIKEANPGFVIECGSDFVMSHDMSPFSQIPDIATYKQSMEEAMKVLMGSEAGIACQQTDSEIAFLIICKR